MQISSPNNYYRNSKLSFGKDVIYNDRLIPNKQDQTHDVIRAHLEDLLGPLIYYHDQLEKEQNKRGSKLHNLSAKRTSTILRKQDVKVDFEALKKLKIDSLFAQRDNELYSGEQLAFKPEILDQMKKAGIKTILALVPMLDYKENSMAFDINFVQLNELQNAKLSVFDVAGELMDVLIDRPDSWVSEDIPKIKAIKEFIKILNGESEEYPPPIYYGCHHGTDRTVMWTQLYKILKDCPNDEPLSDDVRQQLSIFYNDNKEYFRW